MKDTIRKLLREGLNPTITCEKCGCDWKKSESGPDMYFCHKCGHDNTPDNINEAAKQIEDLPEDIGLFVSDNGRWYNFILYSKSEDKIYGEIITSDIEGYDKLQQIGRVAAEKGYGPLMYEIAMTYINPRYLMPSRDGDIKGEAWNVWEKFYKRNDIAKKTLNIQDELFSFVIVTGRGIPTWRRPHEEFESLEEKQEMFNELSNTEKMTVLIFNTIYQYDNPMIYKLIHRAEEQIKNKEVSIELLKSKAEQYFTQKYYV